MARVCEFAVDGHGLFVARRRILSTRIDVELVFRRLWVAALYSSGIQSTRAWRYGVAQEADIAMWFELQDTTIYLIHLQVLIAIRLELVVFSVLVSGFKSQGTGVQRRGLNAGRCNVMYFVRYAEIGRAHV